MWNGWWSVKTYLQPQENWEIQRKCHKFFMKPSLSCKKISYDKCHLFLFFLTWMKKFISYCITVSQRARGMAKLWWTVWGMMVGGGIKDSPKVSWLWQLRTWLCYSLRKWFVGEEETVNWIWNMLNLRGFWDIQVRHMVFLESGNQFWISARVGAYASLTQRE